MSDEDLIDLREFLKSKGGRLILCYACDFMIETSSKSCANAEWVKGMGMLINHLKEVDELCQQKFNRNRKE